MQTRRLDLRLNVAKDPGDLVERAARDVAGYIRRRLAAQDTVSIALSGGSTPGPLYTRLTQPPYRYAIDWSRLRILWADERCVPPNAPDSNFRLVAETFLDRLPQLPEILRMPGELPPYRGAEAYRRTLATAFGNDMPVLDLIILGMGGDAHTASLFPGSEALASARPVLATRSPLPPHARLSLGPRVLNSARKVVFLVHGATKAEIASKVLDAVRNGRADSRYPSSLVRPAGPLTWFLDRPAATQIRIQSARP